MPKSSAASALERFLARASSISFNSLTIFAPWSVDTLVSKSSLKSSIEENVGSASSAVTLLPRAGE
jgi:hypothetical protein